MSAPVRLIIENFLTEDERASATWQSVKAHLERMLAKRRLENDNSNMTAVETARLRGHIECLKAMHALGNKPPEMTATVARPRARPDYGRQSG